MNDITNRIIQLNDEADQGPCWRGARRGVLLPAHDELPPDLPPVVRAWLEETIKRDRDAGNFAGARTVSPRSGATSGRGEMRGPVVMPIAFGLMLLYAPLAPGAARPLTGWATVPVWIVGLGLIALGLYRWWKEPPDA